MLSTYKTIICTIIVAGIQTAWGQSSTSATDLFPVYGITLGETTIKDIEQKGYECEEDSTIGSKSSNCDVETIVFWDFDGNEKVDGIYITNTAKIPDKWIENFGFRWRLSYSEWTQLFTRLGYSIEIEKAPATVEYQNRKTLSASLKATSEIQKIVFELDFNYGNSTGKGYDVNAPFTLYSISIFVLEEKADEANADDDPCGAGAWELHNDYWREYDSIQKTIVDPK